MTIRKDPSDRFRAGHVAKALSACLLVSVTLQAAAQPTGWSPIPTNAAGTLLGTVTVGGAAAQDGDWVAAFDEGGTCAGAVEVILNAGQSYISLPIYGDDATTPGVDEGMAGGEAFTLRLWRSATGEILYHPTPEAPAALEGWSATNGAPMPGYDDAYTVYDFAWDGPTVIIDCPPSPMCLDGAVYNLSASPDNGAWEGPGVFAGFAGYLFDPAVAGYGTHTLTYTTADGLSESCVVTVSETLTPTLSLPLGWCAADTPLALDTCAQPADGNWTGPGVLNTPSGSVFDPSTLDPGTYALTYSVSGPCGGAVTGTLSVYPNPDPPFVVAEGGFLHAENVAPGDSVHWWLDEGWGPYSIGYSDLIFYFPIWATYTLEAINAYGCSTFGPPFVYGDVSGLSGPGGEPLRFWLDAEGRLQANAELELVRWFDFTGRQIAGARGPGPWLVEAVARDGQRERRIFAGR